MHHDIEERIKELRKWATSDQFAAALRSHDGLMELLGEILSELRDVRAELSARGSSDA